MATIADRIAQMKTRLSAVYGCDDNGLPLNGRGKPIDSTSYVVNEGEIPWGMISDPAERRKIYLQQRKRVYTKTHREQNIEGQRIHEEKHPGSAGVRSRRYYGTPKGKANIAKKAAVRRERSTDPEAYAARVEMLHTLRESCAECHRPYTITHQIDHIIALCLDGTDDWDNLQPLCIKCHREKTKEDLRKLMGTK